eukprot:613185-Prymnesium_polylepis.1
MMSVSGCACDRKRQIGTTSATAIGLDRVRAVEGAPRRRAVPDADPRTPGAALALRLYGWTARLKGLVCKPAGAHTSDSVLVSLLVNEAGIIARAL